MSIKYDSDIEKLIKRDSDDILLFLNNSIGDWSSPRSALLSAYFPNSKKADSCTLQTRLSKLATFTTPIKESKRNMLLLNVHVRKSDRSIDSTDEIENLKKALKPLEKVLSYKKIVVVANCSTKLDELVKYCTQSLAGCNITIVAKKKSNS